MCEIMFKKHFVDFYQQDITTLCLTRVKFLPIVQAHAFYFGSEVDRFTQLQQGDVM